MIKKRGEFVDEIQFLVEEVGGDSNDQEAIVEIGILQVALPPVSDSAVSLLILLSLEHFLNILLLERIEFVLILAFEVLLLGIVHFILKYNLAFIFLK